MTVKENAGYLKNGAWYPYREITGNWNGLELEDPLLVKRYPGKFDISFKFEATGEETEEWVKLAEICEDLVITEKVKKR